MSEKIRVGKRGQVVIPKKFRMKFNIESGTILEINATAEGLFLKPINPLDQMKGIGKGLFGDPGQIPEKTTQRTKSRYHELCRYLKE